MTIACYPAIIERARDGFGVFFPDLPGCTSHGRTIEEAALNAGEALGGHIAVLRDYGDPVPAPSALEAIGRDPEVDEVARMLVTARGQARSPDAFA